MDMILSLSIPVLVGLPGFYVLIVYGEPIKTYKQLKGNIASSLDFYANVYSSPGSSSKETLLEAYNKLRDLATQITSSRQQLPELWVLRKLFGLPTHTDLKEASSRLIGLSNSVFSVPEGIAVSALIDVNNNKADDVRRLLNIK